MTSQLKVDRISPANNSEIIIDGFTAASGGGQVDSVVAGTNVTVDNTDPVNPIVNARGKVDSVVAGTNVTVDNTDPVNPIVNSTGSASGSVIQVKSYRAAISFSGTGNTSLSVSITPSSTANKIFILATLSKASSSVAQDGSPAFFGFKRNGTDLGWYAMMYRDGSRDAGHALSYLDSPGSTSAVTYLVHASNGSILNNSNSTITVMEIQA